MFRSDWFKLFSICVVAALVTGLCAFVNTGAMQGAGPGFGPPGVTISTALSDSANLARLDAANVFAAHNTFEGVAATGATGTGKMVFDGTPTLVTPVLGAATATSINGNTFTSGTYTLSGTAAKTLNFTNTLTLSGTDSTTMTFPTTSATLARTDAANTFTGASTGTSWTMTTPVIAGGVTASGAGANTFAGSSGTFLTSTGACTIGGGTNAVGLSGPTTITGPAASTALTIVQTARTSGILPYIKYTVPTDTAQTASTESPGIQGVTGTRTWATTGTVALQREIFFPGPTYASASPSQTFTEACNMYLTPPVAGTNAIFTRGHSLAIVDSTSALSSITGGLVVATALGTPGTSVGIGSGNINAGGTGTFGGNLAAATINGNTITTGTFTLTGTAAKTLNFTNSLTLSGSDSTTMTFPTTTATIARTDAAQTFTGHNTFEGVTPTGATGTGNMVFATSPTLTTPVLGTPSSGTLTSCTGLPLGGLTSQSRPYFNYIINGDCQYAQRQVPLTSTAITTDKYSADRWRVSFVAGGINHKRFDTESSGLETGLNARYYSQFSENASSNKMFVCQPIETVNCAYLRGRTVTCQAKIKTSSAKTMRFGLLEMPTGGTADTMPTNIITVANANSTDPTFGTSGAQLVLSASGITNLTGGTVVGSALNCVCSTTWTQFAFKVTVGTTYRNLVLAIWTDSAFAASDTFSISEVGLFDGDQIRDWLPRDTAAELARCQRYCCIIGDGNAGNSPFGTGYNSTSTVANIFIKFPVAMRAVPSLTVGGTVASDYYIESSSAGANLDSAPSALAIINSGWQSKDGSGVKATCSGLTAGSGCILIGQTSSGKLIYDAEF